MGIGMGGVFTVRHFDRGGNQTWESVMPNVVVATGRQLANNVCLAASAQVSTWYVGLMDGTPTIASANTASDHAGWLEFTNYSEATRPSYTALGSIDQVGNNASKASFAIAESATAIGGAYICSSNVQAGSGGVLFAAASFTADKTANASDTITVEYTASVTSS